jgi:thiol:disulfide interchange protein DsbA
MLKYVSALLFGLAFTGLAQAAAGEDFVAGKNWFPVEPPQPTVTGDKIEVREVFSYACPACNAFQTIANKIKSDLPKNAQMAYLPAAFRTDEDWPVFQRAFFAAQALGIVDKSHDATFDAVWKPDGTLHIDDPTTHQPIKPMPTIEDIAKVYEKFGVKPADFVAVANSFAVNTKMKNADAQLKAYGVDSTPTLIVNGKYRLTAQSAGSVDKVIPLVQFLVARESTGK